MTSRPLPTVVLFSAPETLEGVGPLLRHAGVRVVRRTSLETRPRPPALWLRQLGGTAAPDTVVVTSRAAVKAGLRPWQRAVGGRFPAVEFWAVGPGTAEALRGAGVRRVHRAPAIGSGALLAKLGRRPPRRIAYLRSNAAGPALARALRSRGHRVADVVVYRLAPAPRLGVRAQKELLEADLLVVTSPSGLGELRRQLDRRRFAQLVRSSSLVVLGERSRRRARELGFASVSVAPSTHAQRFTRHLLRELRHARE